MGSSELGPIYRRTGHPSSCRSRHTNRVVRRRSEESSPLTARIRRRHTTAALSAVQAHRGTDGSNPFPSSEESMQNQLIGPRAAAADQPAGEVTPPLISANRFSRSAPAFYPHRWPAATCYGAPTRPKQPGTTKKGDKQIDRARVLEVRIHLPPAESRTNVDAGEVPFRGQVTSESLGRAPWRS